MIGRLCFLLSGLRGALSLAILDSGETCGSRAFDSISSLSACENAAVSLGYSYVVKWSGSWDLVFWSGSMRFVGYGCFLVLDGPECQGQQGKVCLGFNQNQVAVGTPPDSRYVCSIPTTQTTSNTSTTTTSTTQTTTSTTNTSSTSSSTSTTTSTSTQTTSNTSTTTTSTRTSITTSNTTTTTSTTTTSTTTSSTRVITSAISAILGTSTSSSGSTTSHTPADAVLTSALRSVTTTATQSTTSSSTHQQILVPTSSTVSSTTTRVTATAPAQGEVTIVVTSSQLGTTTETTAAVSTSRATESTTTTFLQAKTCNGAVKGGDCSAKMASGQQCSVLCEPGLRVVGYYTCFDGRLLGSSICVTDSFDGMPESVTKIAATLAVGFPPGTRFSQPMDTVLSRSLSSALNVTPQEFSHFSSSTVAANNGRRLRQGALCEDSEVIHNVSYEVVAPSLRTQDTLQASQNIAVAGTEAYSKMSVELTAMSGSGEILPCTEEILAPVLFTDEVARMENGSIVTLGVLPTGSEGSEAAADTVVNGVDGRGPKWWAILSGAGLCLCCIAVLLCGFKRWHKSSGRPRQSKAPQDSDQSAPPLPVLITSLRSVSKGSESDDFKDFIQVTL